MLCAPKEFSSSFSYSTCTNDVGAVTHNERRFQFRLLNHLFRVSWVNLGYIAGDRRQKLKPKFAQVPEHAVLHVAFT